MYVITKRALHVNRDIVHMYRSGSKYSSMLRMWKREGGREGGRERERERERQRENHTHRYAHVNTHVTDTMPVNL